MIAGFLAVFFFWMGYIPIALSGTVSLPPSQVQQIVREVRANVLNGAGDRAAVDRVLVVDGRQLVAEGNYAAIPWRDYSGGIYLLKYDGTLWKAIAAFGGVPTVGNLVEYGKVPPDTARALIGKLKAVLQ